MGDLRDLIANQKELNGLLFRLHTLEVKLGRAGSRARLDELLVRHRKILAGLAETNLELLRILEGMSDDSSF